VSCGFQKATDTVFIPADKLEHLQMCGFGVRYSGFCVYFEKQHRFDDGTEELYIQLVRD
jgi:hypothetical protein